MKQFNTLLFYFIFLFFINSFGQNVNLHFYAKDPAENKLIKKFKLNHFLISKDRLNFKMDSVSKQLQFNGFLNLKKVIIKNDSLVKVNCNLGEKYKHLILTIPKNEILKSDIEQILKTKITTTFKINFNKITYLLGELINKSEENGESFKQFKLQNIQLKNNIAFADLHINNTKIRKIDKVVVKGYEQFSKAFIKHKLSIKPNTIFNTSKLKTISKNIKTVSFIEEIKTPQTLFTKDSTHVYLYLKKKNANKFDGLIGFNSKENSNGIEFNGYLDLHLENMFNYGAKIDLLWKSNGNENQKFNLGVNTPYLFGTAFSPQGNLQIYKQDSSYINIKSQLKILYAINNNNSVATSIGNEVSTNLLDKDNPNVLNNYNSTFYGLHYNYRFLINNDLFPVKFTTNLSSNFGTRTSNKIKTSQTKLALTAFYNWQLNFKNYIYFKTNNGYLISDDYLDNELFRIGGSKTIRGFQEESIFASLYNTVNIEYRYLTRNNDYFYSISDIGFIETSVTNNKLFGFGLGYAFKTKIGLLNLNYVLGKSDNQNFDFSKAVVGLKYVTVF